MSPRTIVDRAVAAGLDAIAVCDHNSTLQVPVLEKYGRGKGLVVFYGVEITTREESHCVALLPGRQAAARVQEWIDAHILKIPNVPEKFGDQVWVDSDEMIGGTVEWYLNSPLDLSVEEIAERVVQAGGLFVPAHVDRPSNSLIGQLGFISPDLPVNAVEYNDTGRFATLRMQHKYLDRYSAYTASDAHFPTMIGSNPSVMEANALTFGELALALAGEDGRRIYKREQADAPKRG